MLPSCRQTRAAVVCVAELSDQLELLLLVLIALHAL